jgi:hypothetical protein
MSSVRRGSRRQGGFILALGLLLLAALALIGTMALSTASFQSDLSNNARLNQEVYYAATVGLSTALDNMIKVKPPRNGMTLASNDVYMVGGFDKKATSPLPTTFSIAGCQAADHLCTCGTNPNCFDYYVEVELKNWGNAPTRWSIGKYFTWYYKVTSTATGAQGNSARASVYVAAVYKNPYQ